MYNFCGGDPINCWDYLGMSLQSALEVIGLRNVGSLQIDTNEALLQTTLSGYYIAVQADVSDDCDEIEDIRRSAADQVLFMYYAELHVSALLEHIAKQERGGKNNRTLTPDEKNELLLATLKNARLAARAKVRHNKDQYSPYGLSKSQISDDTLSDLATSIVQEGNLTIVDNGRYARIENAINDYLLRGGYKGFWERVHENSAHLIFDYTGASAVTKICSGKTIERSGNDYYVREVETWERWAAGVELIPWGKFGKLTKGASKGDTTKIYRAVSKEELLDVAENGFRLGPNSMGNKWFAESACDASAWGKKFYKWDKAPVFTLEIEVPNPLLDKFMRNPRLDGIGPARSADAELLKQLNKEGKVNVLQGNILP